MSVGFFSEIPPQTIIWFICTLCSWSLFRIVSVPKAVASMSARYISDGFVCSVCPRIRPVSCWSASMERLPLFQSSARSPDCPGLSFAAFCVRIWWPCWLSSVGFIVFTNQLKRSPTAACPASIPQ